MKISLGHAAILGAMVSLGGAAASHTAHAQTLISVSGNPPVLGPATMTDAVLTQAVVTLQSQVQTLQGQVQSLQSQLSAANSQLSAVTNALPSIANPCGPGEGYGISSYQNFLDDPGFYGNVGLKFCYVPQ